MNISPPLLGTLAIFLAGGLLGGGRSLAEEHFSISPEPITLSEADAVRMALGNNRELAALQITLKEQEKRAEYAGYSIRNPEIRMQDISTKYAYGEENKQFQIGLRWRPPKMGELSIHEQVELVALWEKKVKADTYRLKLIADVRRTYAEIAMLQEYAELAARRVILEEQCLSIVEGLVRLGQRPLLDQVKARRRLIKARSEASKTQQRYSDAKKKLGTLTGETKDVTLTIGDVPERSLDLKRLHDCAITNRREVMLTEQRVVLSDLQYRAERYKRFPWFSFLEVAYHYESEKRNWGELLMGIELPVFNWHQGTIEATAIAKEGSEDFHAATIESIDREISNAHSRYQQARAEWQSSKAEAEEFLLKSDHLLKEAQREKTLPADDVVDLELSSIEVRQMVLEARLNLNEASIELCTAVGVERWEDLSQ